MSTGPRNFALGRFAGRRGCRLLLGVALVAPIAMATATAAPPMTGIPDNARLVSDNELGEMRGRFIAPESVNFFGIQMVSTWETGDPNVVLTASLSFEATLKPTNGVPPPDPVLLASWSGNCVGEACDSDPLLNITPTGLNSVSGGVQSTEISGDDNDAVNILRLRIGDYTADSFSYEGDPATSTEVTEAGLSVELENGFIVSFSKGDNSLGMILQGPGPGAQGQAIQSVTGGDVSQIAQHVQLVGDANAIQNSLDVVIGINQAVAMQAAVENALSTMKGWGF